MFVVRKSFAAIGPKLYICSTPIGNLSDVSFRLLEILQQVDVVAAEDTRQTRKLLSRYDIHVPRLISYHQHNAIARSEEFLTLWEQGKTVAVVSDAGTPGVSDPGEHITKLAIEAGVPVVPIPGASAVLSALVGSGLPMQSFTFAGFLPREKKQCLEALQSYHGVMGVIIFYEAPHRLLTTMKRIAETFPNQRGVVAKELTKQHETFIYGTVHELVQYVESEPARGEYVILVDCSDVVNVTGNEDDGVSIEAAEKLVRDLVESGVSHADAVKQVASRTGIKRRLLYNETL